MMLDGSHHELMESYVRKENIKCIIHTALNKLIDIARVEAKGRKPAQKEQD